MASTLMSAPAVRPLTRRDRTVATWRNLTLWTLQGWVAMFFIAAGYAKLTEPMANLIDLMIWPAMAPENLVRGLGLAEVVLALMLLAPLTSWKVGRPLLVAGAIGLVVLETAMLGVHALGGDFGLAVVNAVLLAFTGPVLWMRAREPERA